MTERENAATTGVPTSVQDGSTKSGKVNEGGRGLRKKYVFLRLVLSFSGHFSLVWFLSVTYFLLSYSFSSPT